MKKHFLLLSLTAFLMSSAFGQTKNYPYAVGINAGLIEYDGDLGQSAYSFKQAKPFVGLSFGYYISSRFDFAFNTSYGKFGYEEKHNLKFDSKLWQSNVHIRIKILDEMKHKAIPYLHIGIGAASYKNYTLKTTDGGIDVPSLNGNGVDVFIPFGVGIEYPLTERLKINLQETFAYTDHDDRDHEERNTNDAFLMHTLGISYNFALVKDEDHDGVNDNHDKCPKTPAGVQVDKHGCPLDKDGDGIVDYLDACPDVKGVASAKGCPDKDGDGITDKEDECPDVFGIVNMKGCPDKDGDGITDKDDKCPDLFGPKEMMGCPDTDGDGIADKDDECPTEKGIAALRGCPDKDMDGIADKDDKCPDVPGIAANKGCPEVKEEVKKVLAQALQGIQFETGKDIIRKSSYPILNNVVKVMSDNPSYKLSIEGHTDNSGKEDANQLLSDKRAKAVMKYLIDKKIDASRLRAKGFGSSMPVESNATEKGRAKNRRVEFKVEF